MVLGQCNIHMQKNEGGRPPRPHTIYNHQLKMEKPKYKTKDYRHLEENTGVSLFYLELSNHSLDMATKAQTKK